MNLVSDIPKEYRDFFGVDDWKYFVEDDATKLDYVKYQSMTSNGQGFLSIFRRLNRGEKLPPLPHHTFEDYECLPAWGKHPEGEEFVVGNPFMIERSNTNQRYMFNFPDDEYISFHKDSMSNCGMCLFKQFHYSGGIVPKQFNWALKSTLRYLNYPFGFLTHNQHTYENYLEGLPIVDEFINPNSDNTVYLIRFGINHKTPLFI